MTTPLSTLASTGAALRSGELALPAYVDGLCDRIDELNPQVLALLPEPDRRGRLLAQAGALEARFPDAAERPPLYGVAVAVKDIISVDGFQTRAGSALPPELFDGPQASCVTRLREAGALIVGKSVTTEFAYFEPGATRNPHDRDHTPGGSSSGSAAAVAAGLALLALGSQTVGSVIRPAAFCGVVGFKPSYGRIPADGIIYYSPSVDHVGAFAPDASEMALVASVMLDRWDVAAHAAQGERMPVLGVPEGPYLEQAEDEGRHAFEQQLATLERAGCEVRRVSTLEDIETINERHRDLASAEFADVHERWFSEYGALYRPRTALLVETGRAVSVEARAAGLRSRAALRERLDGLMDEHRLDAWVSPPAPGPAPLGLISTGDPAMNLPWTHAGVPALTLPAGAAANGLPLGLQLSARFMADEQLLAWARALEPVLAGEGAR